MWWGRWKLAVLSPSRHLSCRMRWMGKQMCLCFLPTAHSIFSNCHGATFFSPRRGQAQWLVTISLSFLCGPEFSWPVSGGPCTHHPRPASPWTNASPPQASVFPGLNGALVITVSTLLLEPSLATALPQIKQEHESTPKRNNRKKQKLKKMTRHLSGTVRALKKYLIQNAAAGPESNELNFWQSSA